MHAFTRERNSVRKIERMYECIEMHACTLDKRESYIMVILYESIKTLKKIAKVLACE